jgi:hypothetical protein
MAKAVFPTQSSAHPDHHLWRNGRLWWVAFTVHLPGWQKERVRLSLGTDDIEEARRRRDQVLSEYPRATGWRREDGMWREGGGAGRAA